MKLTDSVIEKYGLPMRTGHLRFRGFLSPVNGAVSKKPLPGGVKDTAEYRLITGARLHEGMELVCRGEGYRVLRVEPVCAFGMLSHYEAALRKTGGALHADFD